MTSSTAQDYLELLSDEPKARLALLACSAALRLDDETAQVAIGVIAKANGSSDKLLRRVKNLGCVWRDWDRTWYITEDIRPHLLDRLEREVSKSLLTDLHQHLASSADQRAQRLRTDGQVTHYDKLGLNFEAAYHRLLIPEQSDKGAEQLVDLWRHSGPAAAEATAKSVDYLSEGLNQQLQRVPVEVIFLRGMAARSRGDRLNQERYFREVWARGSEGDIYAIAAHLFALLLKRRDRKIAERALRDSLRWYRTPIHEGHVSHSLGNLLAQDRRRWQEAEKAYERSLSLLENPADKAQVFHSLANLLARDRRRWQEAEQAYRTSIELAHDNYSRAQRMHSLGNLLAKGSSSRRKEAERLYKESIELAPDDYTRAQEMHSLGKLLSNFPNRRDEAESALAESLRLHPKPEHQVQVFGTWVGALLKTRNPESHARAESYALKALELAPNNPQRGLFYQALSSIYEERGDFERALEASREWKNADQRLGKWRLANMAKEKIQQLSQRIKTQDKETPSRE